MEILSQKYLIQRLHASSERVQMWAAYQLVEWWHEEANEFVHLLLESDIPEIKESGIYLVGHQQLVDFAFPVFRIFNCAKGTLKRAAVVALSELQYPPLERVLHSWLEELFLANEVHFQTLQEATQSFLLFHPQKNWWRLHETVKNHYHHHIKSLALFEALSGSIQTPDQLAHLLDHYSIYRKNFVDPQFLNYFLNVFDNQEAIELIRLRIHQGHSINSIYQECLNILGWNPPTPLLVVLEKMDQHWTEKTLEALPSLLIESIRLMFPDAEKFFEEHFLEHFQSILSNWSATIVKIQDQESVFLLSLPLIRFVKETEQLCLEAPQKNTLRIAKIYHSPLLRLPFMTNLLNLLQEKTPTLPSALEDFDFTPDTPREALWRLVTHPAPMENYPFSKTLAEPWNYEMPFLLPRLLKIYKQKFEYCITTGQHEEVEYALELFKRNADEEIINLMLTHFNPLINQHFYLFFEFIEYFPDLRFLPKLKQHYREGEQEIQQLMELLCEIHQQPPPFEHHCSPMDLETNTHFRILCSECHSSYRYPITVLYFDQEALEQRHVFTNKDIWTTDSLVCKNCNAPLPFEIEGRFLKKLYTEMLTAHLLKTNGEEQKALKAYKPLTFPRYFGKKMNPEIFLKTATAELESEGFSPHEQSQLWLEIGKLYLALEQFGPAQEAFQTCLHLQSDQPLARFNLGVIAFLQKNIYEARLHFSHFTQLHGTSDFESEENNLFQLASHYLEILNHRGFKRSTFKLLA